MKVASFGVRARTSLSKFKMPKLSILAFSFLIVSTACTTVTKPDAVDDPVLEWAARQTQLNQITHWNLSGRLAITNKAEVWHLTVKWQQQEQNYKIHLSGPFGAGAVQLKGDDIGVIIKTSDNTTFATNAEQTLYEQTGVKMPIQSLFYWIRGLPNPKLVVAHQNIDEYGRLKKLSQNDWTIRFKRYKKNNAIYLPSKVFLNRESLDIRFVIEEWSISN